MKLFTRKNKANVKYSSINVGLNSGHGKASDTEKNERKKMVKPQGVPPLKSIV